MNGETPATSVWDIWMEELDAKAESTKITYLFYFKKFTKYWDTTPNELYEMRKADLSSGEPRERKRIERMVKRCMAHYRKAGNAAKTCHMIGKTMSSFFDSMDLDLRLKKKDYPRGESKGQVAIIPSQILKMYEQMNYGYFRLRNRAILLSLKDSGLRISDLRRMNYGYWLNAKPILNEHDETFKVFDPMETQKMKVLAYVHLGPESVTAIEEYIEDRQDRGEILREESPIFIGQDGERITRQALTCLLSRYAKNLKLKRISAHSFRKFHTTRLEGAGMPDGWIKKLQGKAANVYSQPEEDLSEKYPDLSKLTERYIDCYDALRVLENPRDKIENERLREELERARAQSPPELTALTDRLRTIENQIAEILEANKIGG